MRTRSFGLAVFVLATGLAGCGGGHPQMRPPEEAWKGHGPIDILRRYAGPDKRLTLKQLEEGLHRDFEAADTNHNGVLDPDEARLVNQQRWRDDQSAVSPLQDWNGDGVIDFNEFAATARALFHEADRDGNGVLTSAELMLGAPAGQKGGPDSQEGGQNGEQGRPPRGERGPRG